MSLTARLRDDVKSALRAGDKPRLGTLRMALASIKQREVDERIELDDAQIVIVLEKMIKQRRESLGHYESAGREDLASRERFEIEVLQQYLPRALSEQEIVALVDTCIAAIGASSMRDMGKVMDEIRARAQGRIDMATAGALVKDRLSA